MNKSIYIAGPMTGLPEWNFPLFHRAAKAWRARGWLVVNPAETDGGDTSKPRAYYMRRDIQNLLSCECIGLLPDWPPPKPA